MTQLATRHSISNRILLVFFAFLSIMVLTSCATRVVFMPNPAMPTAEGKVKVKKDANGNYAISLSVKNLLPANQLTPPRATYLVWMETPYNGAQNLGQLKTSSGIFSSTLKASLETSTPYKPLRFFITAEDNPVIQYPGSQVVLRTNAF